MAASSALASASIRARLIRCLIRCRCCTAVSLAALFGALVQPAVARAGPSYYRLIQYPGSGFGGFYAQIGSARHAIDLEIYELDDLAAERDLAAAAARGVKVRVLLDSAYHGRGVNGTAYAYLRVHGVQVRWAPGQYIFHIKTAVFDGDIADVFTANLTSEYYAETRDAELTDTDPDQVAAIERTFDNDWSAAPGGNPRDQTAQAPGLIWSPNTDGAPAEQAVVSIINRAQHSVKFESEELSDPAIYDALAVDARRNISCEVLMSEDPEWDAAFNTLRAAGCVVHLMPDSTGDLFIHEKAIITDLGRSDESLMLGSQNASWDSLHRNRELGLLITDDDGGAAAITAAAITFEHDFVRSLAAMIGA